MKTNKMKFGIKYYYEPTPKKVQVKVDQFEAACTAFLAYPLTSGNMYLLVCTFLVMRAGKFISECFYEEIE